MPEPWGAQLEKLGNRLVLNEKAIWRGGDYPSAVVIVNTKFAAENPELVKAFLQAHLNAVTFIQRSPAAAQAAVAAELLALTGQKIDPLVLQRALSRTRISADLNTDALAEYAELNRQAGYARSVPNMGSMVNLSVLKSLKPQVSGAAPAAATKAAPSTPATTPSVPGTK